MQAWDKFHEIKHAQSEEVQELLSKLLQDLQSINEELAEYIKLPSWNLPTSSYDDDDDEESSIPFRDIIMSELHPFTRLQSIPSGIDNINLDSKGDILFLERLLYDNSTPRPEEAFQANSDTIIESLSPSPIPVEDNDSLREEIDIFSGPDDSIPPGIESDDYDSEGDDNSTSLPEFESFHVDYPDSRDSTIDVVEDIPVDVPNILPTRPTQHMDFNFIPSNDLGSDHDVSSPSGDRNK
ncbi:hypothetical protein Tco_1159970, partial [Tanacetum coccineum]